MKDPPDVDEAWRAVREVQPDGLDRNGCARQLRDLARLRAWVDAAEVKALRRQKQLAAEGAGEPAEVAAARNSGRSARGSRTASEREAMCDQLSGFEDALSDGEVSAEYIDVLATVAGRLDEATRAEFLDHETELLAHARRESVDTFARRCRALSTRLRAQRAQSDAEELDHQRETSNVRRWTDKVTGMCHTHLELDPVRDAAVWGAVQAQLAKLRASDQQGANRTTFRQLQVDAVVSAMSAGDPGSRVPEIGILVDYPALAADAAAAGLCTVNPAGICETSDGVPLPVSAVRRLACEADVYPVVMGADGVVLDMGRTKRTVTPQQRRALKSMHRTCGGPECTVGFDSTRAHHVRFWTRDTGPTDIDNLLPLCEIHHHLVHEGGWQLSMTPDRVATWRLPDGTIDHRGPTIDRTPDEDEVAA